MDKLLKIVRYFVVGVLIGSFSFLAIILFSGSTEVEPRAILSLFFFSGLIGLISMIFSTDRLIFPIKLLIHIVMTVIIVGLMMYFAGWWQSVVPAHFWIFMITVLVTVLVTYIGVWIMLYLADVVNMKKINATLRKRNEKK